MDLDKINRLREERRKRLASQQNTDSHIDTSNLGSVPPQYKAPNTGLNIEDCKKEWREIESKVKVLIQNGQYDEASQELSYFYDSHKNQDVIGGEFFNTFGFWLNYWNLYIDVSKYENRIINNEHNTQSHSINNDERDIEKNLNELQKDWEQAKEYSNEIEELISRYQQAKNSKDEWTKENVSQESKLLEKNITSLINNEDYDQASQTLLDFYHTAEKTYANHPDILTKEITFDYLYWNSYLNIKILEYYANPEYYDKENVTKLKKQINDDLNDLRMDKDYNNAYNSKIASLYSQFYNAKELLKKHNKGEKQPWSVGCGAAIFVFIVILICKLIWDWGSWTLWVWPLAAFIIFFIGENSDD